MSKHVAFCGFLIAALATLLGVLLIMASFQSKWAYPMPAVFFLTAVGLFLGAMILIMLVVIMEQLNKNQ